MNRPLHRLVPLALVLAAPPLAAQTFEFQDFVRWPSSFGNAGMPGRMASGEFNGDGLCDGVMLLGDRIVVLDGFGIRSAFVPIGGVAANDVDVAVDAGVGLRDAIVFVDAAGLKQIEWSPTHASYDAPWTIEAGDWAGARLVRAADVDNDGKADFVGLGSDGRTILLLRAGATTTATSTQSSDVLDLCPLRWDATPDREIAAMFAGDVHILHLDFQAAGSASSGVGANNALQILCGATRDRLAWLYGSGSNQKLRLLRYGASEDPLDLPDLDAYALGACDVDGDLDDDVVVAHHTHHATYLVPNSHPASPALVLPDPLEFVNASCVDASGVVNVLSSLSAAGDTSRPLCADLDRDGRGDLVLAVRASETLLTFPVLLAKGPETSGGPWLVEPPPGDFIVSYDIGAAGGNGTLEANIKLQFTSSMPWPSAANGMQVIVWRQDGTDGYSPTMPVEQYPKKHWKFLAPSGFFATDPFAIKVVLESGDATSTVPLETGGEIAVGGHACLGFHVYWFEIRPAHFDGDEVVEGFATKVLALGVGSLDASTPWMPIDQLLALNSAEPGIAAEPQETWDCGQQQSSGTPIHIIRRRRVPLDPQQVHPIPLPQAGTLMQ